jgi:DNA-binding transcriptional ArsR family regulator
VSFTEPRVPGREVPVDLTDNPEGRVRVSELAGLLQWERSRISHHIKRMEDRGLVERAECSEDGRGAFVVIAPSGPCCDRGELLPATSWR